MRKTLAFRFVPPSLMVVREDAGTPSDTDWDAFLREVAASRGELANLRVLVYTDGGGPSAPQRARIAELLDSRSVRVAVVTDRTLVRFIVSSIALLLPLIRTFSTHELPGAYAHLNLTLDEQRQVARALDELHLLVRGSSERAAT